MASKNSNGTGTIYRRKDGRYEGAAFVLTSDGRRKRARVYGDTKAETQHRLADLIDKSHRGIPRPDGSWTVSGYMTHWLSTTAVQRIRTLTMKSYEGLNRLYIEPKLGAKRLATLSVADVQSAINDMLREGASPRTVEKVRAVLRAALNSAMRQELIFRNVAQLVQLPRVTRKPIEPWTTDEARAFVRAAEGHRWYPTFMLLLGHGLRKGEALGMRWDDIDFVNGVIHVRQQIQRINGALVATSVKTEAGQRALPLVPHAREILTAAAHVQGIDISHAPQAPAHYSTDNLVTTTSTGGPVDPGNMYRAFQALVREAGVRRITIHQMRHTVATMLAATGAQERDAQLILGHAHVTTTQQIYQHGNFAQRAAALQQVAETIKRGSAESADVSAVDSDGSRCRQELPSNSRITIESAETQDPREQTLTGVEKAESVGTPDWIRTSDQRLRSPFLDALNALPTSVINDLHTRTRRQRVGCVAVNYCRQTVTSDARLNELGSLRTACREALVDRLRRRSFPLNLVPAIDTLEAA